MGLDDRFFYVLSQDEPCKMANTPPQQDQRDQQTPPEFRLSMQSVCNAICRDFPNAACHLHHTPRLRAELTFGSVSCSHPQMSPESVCVTRCVERF